MHGAFSDGTSNYLQLSGKSTYALNKSAYADSLMRYELKTRFTLKNNTNSNRFVLYYYYKNDTEYKTIEIFKQDNRDTLGMQMGLLTENVSGSANATNAGIIKSNVALKMPPAMSWRGLMMKITIIPLRWYILLPQQCKLPLTTVPPIVHSPIMENRDYRYLIGSVQIQSLPIMSGMTHISQIQICAVSV